MTDYLDRALTYVGARDGDIVVTSRIEGGYYILLLDKGIKGIPKYSIPLDALDDPPVEIPGDLHDLGYRELQTLAKHAGIPANQKADDLREALESLTTGDGD